MVAAFLGRWWTDPRPLQVSTRPLCLSIGPRALQVDKILSVLNTRPVYDAGWLLILHKTTSGGKEERSGGGDVDLEVSEEGRTLKRKSFQNEERNRER